MKRATWGVIAAAIASVALVVALQAQEQRLAAQQEQVTAEKEEGKVIFTFADEEKMKAFAATWQQRQAMLAKMAVLESYWKQEQSRLDQTNQQLLADYQLDVNKSYTLDPDRRVLLESPQPATEAGTSPPAVPVD